MSFSDLIAKQYEKELSVIKKAPFSFTIISVVLSIAWVSLFHLGMLNVIGMKNDLIESQAQEIGLLKLGKTGGIATKNDGDHLIRVIGKTFANEKVLLDGYSYVNCVFDRVSFTYNGGLSEVINSDVKWGPLLRLETSSPSVKQIIKILYGLGAFNDRFIPDPGTVS